MNNNKKPRGRSPHPACDVDWETMDAINAKRSETMIVRSAHALSRVLDEIPEVKIPTILGALCYSEKRLLLQTLI